MPPQNPPESFPHPPPPEQEPEPHEFIYFDPEAHGELLRAIALNPDDVTHDWMVELDKLIAEDYALQDDLRKPRNSGERKAVRLHFAEKLGLHDPEHPLGEPYERASRQRPLLPPPGNVVNTMIALWNISGSVEKAVTLAQTGHVVLAGTGQRFPIAARHIRHLAGVLGWKGDPAELLEKPPALLGASVAKRTLLARIAMIHGQPKQQSFSIEEIRQVFVNPSPEAHLMALLLQGEEYTFGQIVEPTIRLGNGFSVAWRAERKRDWIYDRLRDPGNVELMGREILRAFLRYAPPRKRTLERFPHLLEYLPRGLEPTPPPLPDPTRHGIAVRRRRQVWK